MTLIMLLSMTMSLMMIFLSHPLSMGLTLLIQSILMSISISHLMNTSFYSYIVFLVMVGGMMVLFIYMTSIASNEKFMFNPMIMMIMLIPPMILIYMSLFTTNNQLNNSNLNSQLNLVPLMNELWTTPLMATSITTFMYLLITMIATIKITKMNSGPLRHLY